MPARIPLVRVFVASPSDVAAERDAVDRAAAEVEHALDGAVAVRVLRWERDTYPAMGRPQGLVFDQMGEDFDVFVGVMWKRFGSPTGAADSGTEEEFNRAYERWRETGKPPILFFFREKPFYPRTATETEQFARVQAFRQRLEASGLVGVYSSVETFERKVRHALGRVIRQIVYDGSSTAAPEVAAPEVSAPEPRLEATLDSVYNAVVERARAYIDSLATKPLNHVYIKTYAGRDSRVRMDVNGVMYEIYSILKNSPIRQNSDDLGYISANEEITRYVFGRVFYNIFRGTQLYEIRPAGSFEALNVYSWRPPRSKVTYAESVPLEYVTDLVCREIGRKVKELDRS